MPVVILPASFCRRGVWRCLTDHIQKSNTLLVDRALFFDPLAASAQVSIENNRSGSNEWHDKSLLRRKIYYIASRYNCAILFDLRRFWRFYCGFLARLFLLCLTLLCLIFISWTSPALRIAPRIPLEISLRMSLGIGELALHPPLQATRCRPSLADHSLQATPCRWQRPFFFRLKHLYSIRRRKPAMAINGRHNKPFGPGGSTRRLHHSPAGLDCGGGELGSTRA